MMKKFLKKIFYFTLFILVFYFVFIFIWGNFAPYSLKVNLMTFEGKNVHTYLKLKEVKKVRKVDILFIGSSRCYRGFDVRIFKKYNFTSYNLGTTSQSPIQSEMLLKKHLNRIKPKVVVFEVNPLMFSIDGLESSLDIISNDENDFYILNNHIPICTVFLVFR